MRHHYSKKYLVHADDP